VPVFLHPFARQAYAGPVYRVHRYAITWRATLLPGALMDRQLLRSQIERHEGLRLKPYLDTATPPRLTIGYGRNLDDVGITREEADYMLAN